MSLQAISVSSTHLLLYAANSIPTRLRRMFPILNQLNLPRPRHLLDPILHLHCRSLCGELPKPHQFNRSMRPPIPPPFTRIMGDDALFHILRVPRVEAIV